MPSGLLFLDVADFIGRQTMRYHMIDVGETPDLARDALNIAGEQRCLANALCLQLYRQRGKLRPRAVGEDQQAEEPPIKRDETGDLPTRGAPLALSQHVRRQRNLQRAHELAVADGDLDGTHPLA